MKTYKPEVEELVIWFFNLKNLDEKQKNEEHWKLGIVLADTLFKIMVLDGLGVDQALDAAKLVTQYARRASDQLKKLKENEKVN